MILIAKDKSRFFRLDLIPLGEPHREWLGYRIVIGDVEHGELGRLEGTSSLPLFFDRLATPEVPDLCDGFDRACEGEKFFFTPIDERDFELRLQPTSNGVMMSVQSCDMPFADEAGWPLGVLVTAESLKQFAAGLRLEYQEVMKVPLST